MQHALVFSLKSYLFLVSLSIVIFILISYFQSAIISKGRKSRKGSQDSFLTLSLLSFATFNHTTRMWDLTSILPHLNHLVLKATFPTFYFFELLQIKIHDHIVNKRPSFNPLNQKDWYTTRKIQSLIKMNDNVITETIIQYIL